MYLWRLKMVNNRFKKAVSFLGLTLLVASSLTPVQSGPREDSAKKAFLATKKGNAPLTETEATYAVSESYGPKKRNIYEVFDEIIRNRVAPAPLAAPAPAPAPAPAAPQRYVPTP